MASETAPEQQPESAPLPKVESQPLVGSVSSGATTVDGVPAWVPTFFRPPARTLAAGIAAARSDPRIRTRFTLGAVGVASLTILLMIIGLAMERWLNAADEPDIWISLRGSCAGTACARMSEVCETQVRQEECSVLRAGIAMQIFASFGLIASILATVAHGYAWYSGIVRGEHGTSILAKYTTTWTLLGGWLISLLGLIIWAAAAAHFKTRVGAFHWGSAYGLYVFATIIGVVPIFLSVI